MTVDSPDISKLDYGVLFDLSGTKPSVTLTNNSVVINDSVLKWVFEIYSPSGIAIHKGSFATPDRTLWNTPFIEDANFPTPYNQIEWSGPWYQVVVKVQDAQGTIFSLTKRVKICRPPGNNPDQKNTYAASKLKVTTRCRDAKLFIENNTVYEYGGAIGTSVSSIFQLNYPPVEAGTTRPPFIATSFTAILIPISQSGPGYQYFHTDIVDYDFGDGMTVRLKHISTEIFPVYCNIDLTPIAYSLKKLIDDAQAGRCADSAEANRKIGLISAKLQLAAIGILWPQNESIEPFKLIEEINALGGWQCDCCTSGVVPLTAIGTDGDGTSYQVISDGGDIAGDIELLPGNVRIHLRDITYLFELCADNTSQAFTITPSLSGQRRTYCLKVDQNVLADEILFQFENNAGFKNRLNQLIVSNLSNSTISINPRCVLGTNRTNTYVFTTPPVLSGQVFFLQQLTADGVIKPINAVFNRANTGAITTTLNGLNLGVFTVTFINNVLTLTVTTAAAITSFLGSPDGSTQQELTVTRTTSTTSNYNVSTVVQALIDFVCGLTVQNIRTGQEFVLKSIGANGEVTSVAIKSDADLGFLLQQIIASYNLAMDYVVGIKGTDCTALQGLFQPKNSAVSDTTLFYGMDNNACQAYDARALAKKIAQIMALDPAVKDDFCAAIKACGTAACNPVSNASAVYDADAQTITLAITNTGALKYRVAYRKKGDTAWLGVAEVAAATGVTTTKVFTTIPPNTYETQTIAVCASGDALPYIATTQSCNVPGMLLVTQNGGNFEVTVGLLPSNAEKFRIEIVGPNGSTQGVDFSTDILTRGIAIPTGVYGTFSFVARTVCDASAAWYSAPTNTVTSVVNAPAACPAPIAVLVTDVTATTATVTVTKPSVGTPPLFYILEYQAQGGAVQSVTQSSGGSTVVFNLTGLTANKPYSLNAYSSCGSGLSAAYYGGQFLTQPLSGSLSALHNAGTTTPTSVTLKINGIIVAGVENLAAGASVNFSIASYLSANVELKVCDGNAVDAVLITNSGTTHNPTSANAGTFFWSGLALTTPTFVHFSNTTIP